MRIWLLHDDVVPALQELLQERDLVQGLELLGVSRAEISPDQSAKLVDFFASVTEHEKRWAEIVQELRRLARRLTAGQHFDAAGRLQLARALLGVSEGIEGLVRAGTRNVN